VWSGVGNTRDPSAGKPVQSNALKMPHMLLCPLDSVLEYVVGDGFYKEPHQMFRTTDRPMASVHLFEFKAVAAYAKVRPECGNPFRDV